MQSSLSRATDDGARGGPLMRGKVGRRNSAVYQDCTIDRDRTPPVIP
jgi:hypothetical protein